MNDSLALCLVAASTLAGFSSTLHAAPAPQTAAQTVPAQPSQAPPTDAERIRQLEAQVQELEARLKEAEADLIAAKERVAQLEGTPAPQPAGTVQFPILEPGDTITSVEQFLNTTRAHYTRDFPPVPDGADPVSPVALQRAVDKWVTATNRAWKQPLRWTVRVQRVERSGDDLIVTAQALNPDDGTLRGEPIAVRLDRIQSKRFEQSVNRTGAGGPLSGEWIMTGVFTPRLAVNMRRMGQSVFNNPPLVGPGVEFGYGVSVDAFAPVKPQATKNKTPAPTPAP
ncbi:MAG: hypothetical protein SGJ11_18250 [Phycisphaerae bacterium]|nr:hypothetical protein [Phycisphaerae bacterium]